MTAQPAIREASRQDLTAIYELAARALVLDRFSRELLAEKLFSNPRAGEMVWRTDVAETGGQVVAFMQQVLRPAARKAWIGLFAVDAAQRRRGLATALYERARQRWPAEIGEIEVLAIPGNYFTPGLDPRYTAALCFLERCGFERFKDCVNLTAELPTAYETKSDERRLADAGVTIRRAKRVDEPALDAFVAEHFGDDWRYEAGLALQNDPPALHLALRGGRVLAFSAHSTQNREWGFFGPMGTAPGARGLGVGRVLLWHCLNDLRAAGHTTTVIPWVGPIGFYARWAGARVERVFWRYRAQAR